MYVQPSAWAIKALPHSYWHQTALFKLLINKQIVEHCRNTNRQYSTAIKAECHSFKKKTWIRCCPFFMLMFKCVGLCEIQTSLTSGWVNMSHSEARRSHKLTACCCLLSLNYLSPVIGKNSSNILIKCYFHLLFSTVTRLQEGFRREQMEIFQNWGVALKCLKSFSGLFI